MTGADNLISISSSSENNHTVAENLTDLSFNYIPVLLSISPKIPKKTRSIHLINMMTDWDLYRDIITPAIIDLKVRLKSPAEHDAVSSGFTTIIKVAVKEATPN